MPLVHLANNICKRSRYKNEPNLLRKRKPSPFPPEIWMSSKAEQSPVTPVGNCFIPMNVTTIYIASLNFKLLFFNGQHGEVLLDRCSCCLRSSGIYWNAAHHMPST